MHYLINKWPVLNCSEQLLKHPGPTLRGTRFPLSIVTNKKPCRKTAGLIYKQPSAAKPFPGEGFGKGSEKVAGLPALIEKSLAEKCKAFFYQCG
jgi:hypothetical protein